MGLFLNLRLLLSLLLTDIDLGTDFSANSTIAIEAFINPISNIKSTIAVELIIAINSVINPALDVESAITIIPAI